jgi:hypothetical protein
VNLRQFIGVAVAALLASGCSTLRAYEGSDREPDEVALIAGDYRFNAGSPLTLILRAVDGKSVDAQYHAVEVLAGDHTFVVDCVLREPRTTSRHEVAASVEGGRRYGLTAELAPGLRGCSSVQLEPRD